MRPIVIRSAGADEIARAWGDLRRVDRQRKGSEVMLDVSALTEASAAFEAFVVALDRHATKREIAVKVVDPSGLIAPIRARYDFSAYSDAENGDDVSESLSLSTVIGRCVCGWWRSFWDNAAFLGETAVWTIGMLWHPGRFRFRDSALAFERAGFDGLPITTLIGFLLGLILAFESAASLQMFGVEVYVADLIAIGLFRELGPLVTAIILAGRSGSAFAAEIGTMKVDEELDALTTFGLPPVQFLVLPRVVAAMLAMPVLTICSELAGLVGGAIVLRLMDVPHDDEMLREDGETVDDEVVLAVLAALELDEMLVLGAMVRAERAGTGGDDLGRDVGGRAADAVGIALDIDQQAA